MEGDEYLGFSGRFLDPGYCHWHTDLTQASQVVVANFPSDVCKGNWDQAAADYMRNMWVWLHTSPATDYGVGESLPSWIFHRFIDGFLSADSSLGELADTWSPPTSVCTAMKRWTYLVFPSKIGAHYCYHQGPL